MLDTSILREILKEIYGVEDKYLVALSTHEFAPSVEFNAAATWIGYRVLTKQPYIRAYQAGRDMVLPIKCRFRLSFVGTEAEELANQTMLWDMRTDVRNSFESRGIQLNYVQRQVESFPLKQGGYNDELGWKVDFDCQTFYQVDTRQKLWKEQIIFVGGMHNGYK